MITGDTMFLEGGQLVPAPEFINFDKDLARESLKKLATYDVENVICYHGGLFNGDANRRIKELAR